jgi:hypothetical protein
MTTVICETNYHKVIFHYVESPNVSLRHHAKLKNLYHF